VISQGGNSIVKRSGGHSIRTVEIYGTALVDVDFIHDILEFGVRGRQAQGAHHVAEFRDCDLAWEDSDHLYLWRKQLLGVFKRSQSGGIANEWLTIPIVILRIHSFIQLGIHSKTTTE